MDATPFKAASRTSGKAKAKARLIDGQVGKADSPKPNLMGLLCEALERPGFVSGAYSMFHHYSFSNALWVAKQMEERGQAIGPVATFKRWLDLGRRVKKGEKALCMYMPVSTKPQADTEGAAGEQDGDEPGRRMFFVARHNWFSLGQTEVREGGHDNSNALAETADWSADRALRALDITREDFQCTDGNMQGYATPNMRRIAISPLAQLPQKTTFHEIAHVLLHAGEERLVDGAELGQALREVEAEATAYLCCAVLGLHGLDESRGYIQSWMARAATGDLAERHARRIFSAVERILRAGKPADEEQE